MRPSLVSVISRGMMRCGLLSRGSSSSSVEGQRALQQRVARLDPVHDGGVGYVGRRGPHRLGQLVLGLDEVDLGEEVVAVDDLGHMGAHALGVGGEDADDLLALLVLEVADLVVGLDDLGRFDVERAS